ncbi:MAG TPA: ferrous iron transporter B [Steroidobacteraceae bacterium]|jgi:ferrous iron transport protein B|nr:ferrous iron transporter B [Steroidobacteraceae bacterium]HXP26062.1 ferrous iron transporter B [Steroidobacteraceae bacterium]
MDVASSAPSPLIALVGNPNCGKTALFNILTGSRQKVANYAGVTVERKEGSLLTPSGARIRILDLPGAYSLDPLTPDEQVTADVLLGRRAGETAPDFVVCVTDATNLRQNLRLVLSLKRLGLPMVVALNMTDIARRKGIVIDADRLAVELGVPVVETVGVKTTGVKALIKVLDSTVMPERTASAASWQPLSRMDIEQDQAEVRRILGVVGADRLDGVTLSDRLDALVLHPVLGPVILAVILFLVFQAVFAWAQVPMDEIKNGIALFGNWLGSVLPSSLIKDLLINGVLAGVGSVLVFLPQIIILFFFILVLEDSGYLPRAAFLLDRVMGSVGLSGRAFIPLLSSFACAIPGIMATRTIQNPRDRLATIMIAPLMTCSARLPVYALIIGAFIPRRTIWGGLELQGVVLFALYVIGVVSAMAVAFVLKRTGKRGGFQALMLELPAYHWPNLRNLAIGLWQRVEIFMSRVGTIILALMVILWALSSFPAPPPGATGPAIQYSIAGHLGAWLAVLFKPIGFNWQISIALVPGLAAREVAVGALGTVYALSATGNDVSSALTPLITQSWSLPTALSLLAWYVFAPQCLSTLATVKRETNSWRYPIIMAAYLFAMAYVGSWITFRIATALS